MSQLRFVRVLALAVFIAAMVSAGDAKAKGAKVYNTKGTASGTNTSVPIDISGDSCTLVSTIEICTATSSLGIYSGTSSGGPPGTTGAYTGQSILQTIPVAGVGCSFAPETIASCKIGSNTLHDRQRGRCRRRPSATLTRYARPVTPFDIRSP